MPVNPPQSTTKTSAPDLLAAPEIQRHTERILALQAQERQTRQQLGRIVAEIGAELIAVKEALDRNANKTAWLRWLKTQVRYSVATAENYMRVACFTQKIASAYDFLAMEPTSLYRLAALPDDLASRLTPDTLLTDPKTGRSAPLKTLSTRELDRALDGLEGKSIAPVKPNKASVVVTLSGETREAVAADAKRIMGQLANELSGIRGHKGSLTGASKQQVLEAIEQLRNIVLKWPAWATPAHKRPLPISARVITDYDSTSKSQIRGRWSEKRTSGISKLRIVIPGLCRIRSNSILGAQLG